MEAQQPLILDTAKPRTQEQIQQSLTKLRPVFDSVWEIRDQQGAEPLLVPHLTSGNGLPVFVMLRDFPRGEGYTIALYEDGRQSPAGGELTQIGYRFVNNYGGLLVSDTSSSLSTGRNRILFNWNPVTKDFPKEEPSEEEIRQKEEQDPYIFNLDTTNDAIRIDNDHQRRGLATTLYDITMLIAQKTHQPTIEIDSCNEKSAGVVKKLGYTILEEKPNFVSGTDFVLEVPAV